MQFRQIMERAGIKGRVLRTITVPIFKSLSRMVPTCARASSVPSSPSHFCDHRRLYHLLIISGNHLAAEAFTRSSSHVSPIKLKARRKSAQKSHSQAVIVA